MHPLLVKTMNRLRSDSKTSASGREVETIEERHLPEDESKRLRNWHEVEATQAPSQLYSIRKFLGLSTTEIDFFSFLWSLEMEAGKVSFNSQ